MQKKIRKFGRKFGPYLLLFTLMLMPIIYLVDKYDDKAGKAIIEIIIYGMLTFASILCIVQTIALIMEKVQKFGRKLGIFMILFSLFLVPIIYLVDPYDYNSGKTIMQCIAIGTLIIAFFNLIIHWIALIVDAIMKHREKAKVFNRQSE